MAHELTIRKNGFAEMAYAGDTPWHGLGQTVTRGASIDEWQIQAGMDWTIQESPVEYSYSANGMKCRSKVTDKKVLYRSDTFAPLGTVGAKYNVVQPSQILEFFRDLTGAAGFEIETAGTLFGGSRFWALANIGDACEIVPGDKVGGYLLLVTAADGTLATEGRFTTIRVVCNNTLSMSLSHKGDLSCKISHKTKFVPEVMKAQLGIGHENFTEFSADMRRLADKQVRKERAERLLFDLLKNPDSAKENLGAEVERVSKSKGFETILGLFNGEGKGSNLDGVSGTAWGFVNAVTEYADFMVRAKSQDTRLNSAWFGPGEKLKQKAVELVTAM